MNVESDEQNQENVATHDDTIEDLERKLADNPDSANLHYNLGLAFARVKEWEKSMAEFRIVGRSSSSAGATI